MSNVIPFNFKNHNIRVILDDDGSSLFIAKDITELLGYANHSQTIDDNCSKSGVSVRYIPTLSNNYKLITEGNLYRLILKSNKPEAEQFESFVCDEVLPTIRKTGSFSTLQSIPDFTNPAEAARAYADQYERAQLAIETKAEIGTRREATAMNTASQAVKKANKLEIELDQSKEYCTVKRMQMLKHGQKFKWGLLKSTGIEMGINSIDVFDANYGTVKAYHVEVWKEAYAIDLMEVA